MSALKACTSLVLLALLAGCATGPRYACGVPAGVTCRPVSEVHAETISGPSALGGLGDGPSTAMQPTHASEDAGAADAVDAGKPVTAAVKPGDPILTAPRVLRLWIAPWEDAGRDLHDETYLYLRLDEGEWQIAP